MRRPCVCLSFLLMAAMAQAQPAGRPALTASWLEAESSTVSSVPQFEWLDDGTVILLDNRNPENARTFERLVPQTGVRSPMLNARSALQSLTSLRTPGSHEGEIEWPAAFSRDGKRAAYLFDGDVSLLDLPSSSFRRITRTSEEEKDVTFSPDGTMLSYVRSNNLFVFPLAS